MKLHLNVLHKPLFSTECDKCVCTIVKETDVGFCVVALFIEMLEVCQQSYTQRRVRMYQHLKDLNSERPETENAKALRYNRKFLFRILEHRHVEE